MLYYLMKKQAVILAAGKGVRMLHLTAETPKPLIVINNKPFLYYLLENLKSAGYEKLLIVVGHKKEKLFDFIKNNGFDFEIEFVNQEQQLGTGHAVKLVHNFVSGNFVVINGDNLYSPKDLAAVNLEDNYNYIFALEHEHPERFGVLKTENDFLIEIEEKPKKPSSNLINAGLYKFTPEIFDALDHIKKSERGEYELPSAISLLADQKKFKVQKLKNYFVDLGVFDDVPSVEKFVKENFQN